jgi:hypothetical protein
MEQGRRPDCSTGALAGLALLAPRRHRELLRGMVAELEALTAPGDRIRFAIGGCWAIVRMIIEGWAPAAAMWLGGAGAGVFITLLDTHAGGACILAPLVFATGGVGGLLAPRGAWRSAVAILGGLVCGGTVTPRAGWLDGMDVVSLLPFLVTAVYAGTIARRLLPGASGLPAGT